MATFDEDGTKRFGFADYQDIDSLQNAILSTSYGAGLTNIASGMSTALDQVKNGGKSEK